MMSDGGHPPITNRLLEALPITEQRNLLPHLKQVALTQGEILHEPGEEVRWMYFPTGALISLVVLLADGATTEFALIGCDGIVGMPAFLGGMFTNRRAIVQISGNALRIESSHLEAEFAQGGALYKYLLLWTQALLTQISQTAVCRVHHPMKARLARWFLQAQDCIQSSHLPLTQEYVATLLGTRRASVTLVAQKLQQQGAIRYSRGHVMLCDRSALHGIACECYDLIRQETDRLLPVAHLTHISQ